MGRRESGKLHGIEPYDVGANHVHFVGTCRGQDGADLAGGAHGGTVSFHANYRVANSETGLEIFVKIYDHVSKILVARKTEMILGLENTGNTSKHVFGGS